MKETFPRLIEALCESETYGQIQDVFSQLRRLGDCSDDLLKSINEALAVQNWRCVGLLIIAVQWFPDRKFTPLLCYLLENHKEDIANLEDIADLLSDIQDESSVPYLIRALDYAQPGDDYCHFNKKLLHALRKIGTGDAIAGLRGALQSPEELIRQAAGLELEAIGEIGQ